MASPIESSFASIKPDLAVGIVVYRDLNGLAETIRSVKPLSENIYVLCIDPESDPQSIIDAEGVTERFDSPCRDNYAAARNFLIEQLESTTSLNWLFWIHCSERFDSDVLSGFEEFISTELNRDQLYVMIHRRLVHEDGSRHDLDEETIDARLMPLRKGLRYQGPVRETLYTSARNLMIQLSAAPGRLIQKSKFGDPVKRKRQGEYRLKLVEGLIFRGESLADELLAFRAEARFDAGDYVGSRSDWTQLAERSTKTSLRLEAFYSIWETMMLSPVSETDMTRFLLQALDQFPVDIQLMTFMGANLQQQGRVDLAIRSFETAVKHGCVSLDVWHRLHIREIAVVRLALLHRMQGRIREAIRILEDNLSNIDDPSEYVRYLFDMYIVEFMEVDAHDLAARVWGGEELDNMRNVLTGACRASAGAWEAAVLPLESAYLGGCRDRLCLRWYSLALLSLYRLYEAVPILQQWVQAVPESTEARAFLFAAQHSERFDEILHQMKQPGFDIRALEAEHGVALQEFVDASGQVQDSVEEAKPLFGDAIQTSSFDFEEFEIELADNDPTSSLIFREKQ